MTGDNQIDRVQQLFLLALELPVDQRESWLNEQCGDDQALFQEILSLLQHDSPEDDVLEAPLDQAIELDKTLLGIDSNMEQLVGDHPDAIHSDQFLSRLAEVGILSSQEIDAIENDLSDGDPSSDPRQVASDLVEDGKLTEYQASALLHGKPKLLIDKYLILDLIGRGGMGTVYKAKHRPMNRIVAVKMISTRLLASSDQVQRFLREVRVAATLENVNIVRAYDADQYDGVHFLVMEYVRGDNLAKIVRSTGPLTVENAVDCIRQAAIGLRYAHQHGVVHRDIKPGNLMRTHDMQVRVLDMGLADVDESFRQIHDDTLITDETKTEARLSKKYQTEVGAVLGTASFMAPEQARDARSADPRSDIYSLGCTLFFLLTGEPPFKGKNNAQVMEQHRESEIPSLTQMRRDVPKKVESIYQRMLAKEPSQRFQSMMELLAACEDCGLELGSRRLYRKAGSEHSGSGRFRRFVRSRRRDAWVGRVLCGVLVAILIGGASWIYSSPDPNLSVVDDAALALPVANWRHRQHGPDRTSFNPHEHEIGPHNVGEVEILWKNHHACSIRSGVCVVGDVVYYGDYHGEFRAVDAVTGATIWNHQLDGKHQGHAIVDDVAYVSSINRLYAFDAADGDVLWTQVSPSGKFGGLLVVDDICYVGTDSPPKLHAFSVDGNVLWNVSGGTVAGGGKEMWNVSGGSIAISDGMIYKSLEQTLQVLDSKDGSLLWQVTVPEGRLTGPAVSDGIVYLNSSAGKVYAFDVTDRTTSDREPLWVGETPPQVAIKTGPQEVDGPQTPAVGHGLVFVGANDCFYAFEAGPGGPTVRDPIWETTVEAPFFSNFAPAIANGVVYSAAGNHDLYAFDVLDGEVLWNFRTDGKDFPMRSTPTIANGQLYHAATFDYSLYAFRLQNRLSATK